MKKRPLSASSMKSFLQCALKYYYRYELHKPTPGRTDPLAFGTAVHEALEFMHTEVMNSGEAPSPELYDQTLKVFMDSAIAGGLSDMNLLQEGRDMLIQRLDAVDPSLKIVGLELGFELETPNGAPYRGSIDKLIELDPQTVVVVDYKTSRTALTQEEADTDIQLSLYDLAVSTMFPQYTTIICVLDYLRLDEVVTHRTPEQRSLFVSFVDSVYEAILNTEEEDVKGAINTFCAWCDYRNFCPDYKALLDDPDVLLPPLGELTDGDFVDAWARLDDAKRIVEQRRKELSGEAYARMMNANTISGEGKEIYKVQTAQVNYDSGSVFRVVQDPEDFARMVSINKRSLDKYVQCNPDKLAEIEQAAVRSYRAPYFRVRTSKS